MATYVNNLRLKEIATGDESGTWGTSTNTNLELIADSKILFLHLNQMATEQFIPQSWGLKIKKLKSFGIQLLRM